MKAVEWKIFLNFYALSVVPCLMPNDEKALSVWTHLHWFTEIILREVINVQDLKLAAVLYK
eukprot:Pgem_evm1s19760